MPKLGVVVTEEMRRRLKTVAAASGQSLSDFASVALEREVQRAEAELRNRLVRENPDGNYNAS